MFAALHSCPALPGFWLQWRLMPFLGEGESFTQPLSFLSFSLSLFVLKSETGLHNFEREGKGTFFKLASLSSSHPTPSNSFTALFLIPNSIRLHPSLLSPPFFFQDKELVRTLWRVETTTDRKGFVQNTGLSLREYWRKEKKDDPDWENAKTKYEQ